MSRISLMKLKGVIQPEDYKLIPLTKGKFAKVDNEDFEQLSKISFYITKKGYARSSGRILMHRMFFKDIASTVLIDHINHDTLDNRRCNLRLCDKFDNIRYQKIRTGYTSVYKGVSWDSKSNKWTSQIQYCNKRIYLGRYNCELQAAKEYDKKALELFGEFSYVNFKKKS